MSIAVNRVLYEVTTVPGGQTVTLKDPVTLAVLAVGVTPAGASGTVQIPVPFTSVARVPIVGTASGQGNVSAVLSVPGITPVALTGSAAGVGGGSGTLTAPAATPPLVPNNPNFATDVGSTTGVTDAWWRETDGNGTNTITWITAPAELNGGAHAMQLSSTNASTGGDAYLEYKFTKAEIDASTAVLTFDMSMPSTPSGRIAMFVLAKDSGGTIINSMTNGAHILALLGPTGTVLYASAADKTTLYTVGGGTINTQYTKSFNLKTWVQSKLNAGKTWADVASVTIVLNTYAQSGYSPAVLSVNNFR